MKSFVILIAVLFCQMANAHESTADMLHDVVLKDREIASMIKLLEKSRAWSCEKLDFANFNVNHDALDTWQVFTLKLNCSPGLNLVSFTGFVSASIKPDGVNESVMSSMKIESQE